MWRIGLLLCVVLAAGCGGGRKEALLDGALSLLRQRPDSALLLAQQARPSRWAGAALRAKYGLTLALALDKNYIDSDNDSLIRPAWAYYEEHPAPDSLRMMANYQYGRICETAGNYRQAIRYYLAARELAHALQHNYYMGLSCARLGDIYEVQMNYREALDYYRQSYEYTQRLGDPERTYIALHQIGTTLGSLTEYEEAQPYLEKSLEMARQNNDLESVAGYLINLGLNSIKRGDAVQARRCMQELERVAPDHQPFFQHTILYKIHLQQHQIDSARRQLEAMRPWLESGRDSAVYAYYIFFTESRAHNYARADSAVNRYIVMNDSITRAVLTQSAAVAEKKFYQEQAESAKYRLRARQTLLVVLTIAFVLLILVIVLLYRGYIRRQQTRITAYTAIVEELQGTTQRLREEIQQKQRIEERLKGQIMPRIEMLEQLGRMRYEYPDDHKQHLQIIRQVERFFKELTANPKEREGLVELVNALHNDILKRVREQLPRLRSADFDLLTYIYIGFSTQHISVLLNDSVQNIYVRKSRLKRRIAESDAPDKEEFIEKLR